MTDRIYRVKTAAGGRYAIERDGKFYWMRGDVFGEYGVGDEVPDLSSEARSAKQDGGTLQFLAPVSPSIVACIGLNYKDHAAEMKKQLPEEPLVFFKPQSAVVGPDADIRIPSWAGRIEHEAEVAVVIGRRASRVTAASAMDYVLGITCFNDVTARELQAKDGQYSRAKGFDTFAPVGPCIAVGLDPSALDVEGWVNSERRQKSNTRELIFPVPYLIEHITRFMTLNPGDLIPTGTPSGVGPLQPGDRVMIKVQGVGTLSNPCAAANL